MKWHKIYTRELTEEEKEIYGNLYTFMWEGHTPNIGEEVLVTFPLSSGGYSDTSLDNWIEYDMFVGFENTDADVIYWTELPEFKGEQPMNKKQKIQELTERIENSQTEIDELKKELEELQEKPYKISYPKDGAEVYYFDDYTGELEKRLFDIDHSYDKYLYEIGLSFQTEQQAEQFLKEQTLIKKIKCWAKEQQGDWKPDWSNENEGKHYMGYHYEDKCIYVVTNKSWDSFLKLPYFKSKEITRACIDEFGDEIIEVFC